MKRYLQLSRAHTAPLEAVPAALGAALAVGELFNLFVLVWGVFGVLYHITGYADNSHTDWVRGYDKDDPNKQHHPLNQGDFGPLRSGAFVMGMTYITFIYGLVAGIASVALVGDSTRGIIALLVIIVMYISGRFYNIFGKETSFKFIPISLAHSTVFVLPYIILSGESFKVAAAGFVYVFNWVWFQIAISGELKDIEMDEQNFLHKLGCYVYDGRVEFSTDARGAALTIKLITFAFAMYLADLLGARNTTAAAIAIALMASIILTHTMMKSGKFNRTSRIRNMAMIEMVMVYTMCIAAAPVITWPGVALLSVASAVWVVSLNYIEWGTIIAPEV